MTILATRVQRIAAVVGTVLATSVVAFIPLATAQANESPDSKMVVGITTTTISNSDEENLIIFEGDDGEMPPVQAPRPTITFIKAICVNYDDINMNPSTPDNFPEVNAHNPASGKPDVLNNASISLPVSKNEISSNCVTTKDWKFNIGTGYSQSNVGNQVLSEVTTDKRTVSAGDVKLSQDETNVLADGGSLWINEEDKAGYGFGTIRCYNDARNGDNMEFIAFDPNVVDHVTCIAYNVRPKVYIQKRVKGAFAPASSKEFGFKTVCHNNTTTDKLKADEKSDGRFELQARECVITETDSNDASMVDVTIDNAVNVSKSADNREITFTTPASGEVLVKFINYFEVAPVTTTTTTTTIVPVTVATTIPQTTTTKVAKTTTTIAATTTTTIAATTTTKAKTTTTTTTAPVEVAGVTVVKAQTPAKTGLDFGKLVGISTILMLVGTALAFIGRRGSSIISNDNI